MTVSPASDSQRAGALLRLWAKKAAPLTAASAALGVAQYALYAGFAWGAASAAAAFIAGESALPGLSLALACAVLRALAQWGEARSGFEAGARVRAHVRGEAARAMARRGPSFTEQSEAGAAASALIDSVEKLDGFYSRFRPLRVVAALGPLMLIAAAFQVSHAAGFLFLAALPVLAAAMALSGAGAAVAARGQMDALRRLAGRFNDRFQTLETLNAFNAAGRERAGLEAAADDFRKRTMKVLAAAFLTSGALELISAATIALTALYAGLSLTGRLPFDPGETLTLATGLFILLLAPEVFAPMRRLSGAYHDHGDAQAAAATLAAFMDAAGAPAPSRPAPAISRAPELSFIRAGSIYAPGRAGLATLSFTAPAGRMTCLWGPSGAGKSTALKLLMGYAPLTSGRIELDGEPLEAPLAGRAAWIGQNPRLFHGDLLNNITLGDPSITLQAAHEAAETAGVMEFANDLPGGLGAPVGEQGHGLSGGQAQRVALARALAADMKLLLLDEPTAHLDGEAEARFLDALVIAAKGRTVLIATHSAAVRARCHHVVELGPAGEAAA